MKKLYLALLVVFVITANINAQDKPFIGYDKVAWGTSISEVQRVYSLTGVIPVQVENSLTTSYLLEQLSSGSITQRRFDFADGKLWQVVVFYMEGTDSNHSTLRELLRQRYGNPTNIDVQIGSMKIGIAEYRYRDTISIFGQFAPDIEVRLLLRVLTEISDQNIMVFYSWKKLKDEYDASQLGL